MEVYQKNRSWNLHIVRSRICHTGKVQVMKTNLKPYYIASVNMIWSGRKHGYFHSGNMFHYSMSSWLFTENHSLCFPAVYREHLDTKEKPDTAPMVLDAASLLNQAALGVTQDHFQLPWTAVHQNCLTRLQHRWCVEVWSCLRSHVPIMYCCCWPHCDSSNDVKRGHYSASANPTPGPMGHTIPSMVFGNVLASYNII